ncbi:MAG: hypothetical protein K0R85_889 [Devosia sp.]|nr:hypothetical protein [Devosia sp.]
MGRVISFAVCSLLVGALAMPALAQEVEVPALDKNGNVFLFGGVYSSESVGETLNFIATDYQDAYMLGAGYQHFFLGQENGFRLGLEGGAAVRKGPDFAGEVWAGVVARSDGFINTDKIKISASITGGLSLITNPLDVEVVRELKRDGDSTFLFYMAPELSISTKDNPDMEFFWRVQHRSGGWNTLGHMGEGANANTLGVRWSF